MSESNAWIELVNSNGSDEHLALCAAALAEIQENLRGRISRRLRAARPSAIQKKASYLKGWDNAVAVAERS